MVWNILRMEKLLQKGCHRPVRCLGAFEVRPRPGRRTGSWSPHAQGGGHHIALRIPAFDARHRLYRRALTLGRSEQRHDRQGPRALTLR